MPNKTTSIVALSQNEISNVSGSLQYNPLPLYAVVATGAGMALAAGIASTTGGLLALGTLSVVTLTSYGIIGDDLDRSIRNGVITEAIVLVAALGLQLLQQNIARQHNG